MIQLKSMVFLVVKNTFAGDYVVSDFTVKLYSNLPCSLQLPDILVYYRMLPYRFDCRLNIIAMSLFYDDVLLGVDSEL